VANLKTTLGRKIFKVYNKCKSNTEAKKKRVVLIASNGIWALTVFEQLVYRAGTRVEGIE